MGVALAIVVASLMVVVAGYCAVRPVAAWRWRRSTERDADLAHVLMGLAMAAMIESRLARPLAGALVAVFCAAVLWFGGRWLGGLRVAAGRAGFGGCSHPLTHALACGATAVMLLAASGVTAAAAPALMLGLVLALACSLVFATGRLAPAPVLAGAGPPGAGPPGARPAGAGLASAPAQLAPRLAGCCQIVMGAAMIWMLLPMI